MSATTLTPAQIEANKSAQQAVTAGISALIKEVAKDQRSAISPMFSSIAWALNAKKQDTSADAIRTLLNGDLSHANVLALTISLGGKAPKVVEPRVVTDAEKDAQRSLLSGAKEIVNSIEDKKVRGEVGGFLNRLSYAMQSKGLVPTAAAMREYLGSEVTLDSINAAVATVNALPAPAKAE